MTDSIFGIDGSRSFLGDDGSTFGIEGKCE